MLSDGVCVFVAEAENTHVMLSMSQKLKQKPLPVVLWLWKHGQKKEEEEVGKEGEVGRDDDREQWRYSRCIFVFVAQK